MPGFEFLQAFAKFYGDTSELDKSTKKEGDVEGMADRVAQALYRGVYNKLVTDLQQAADRL